MTNRLHKDELQIEAGLVRKLVDGQFPQYANLPLKRLAASGSTNVQFRLGDELLVRFPRQPGGSAGIDKERRWTQVIGTQLPVAVPDIVAVGEPALDYGERWAVVRWLEGEHPKVYHPEHSRNADHVQLANEFSEILLTLREIDIPASALTDRQLDNYRGHSLADYDKQMRRNIEQCRSIAELDLDLDAALSMWNQSMTLPGAQEAAEPRWYHSDLVAENLLLNNGHLTGVLDFGGLGVGDPTVDLHGAWELLDPVAREVLRNRLGVDDEQWLRGRAWALAIALMTFPYYWHTMPGRVKDRLAMTRSVLDDAADVPA